MNLINPPYRVSRLQFFQYTLAYLGLLVVVGVIFIATGASGDWIWLLVGSVLFLVYLQRVVRARLKDMSHSPWWALAILIPVVILPWWALLTPGFVIFICILWMILTLLFFPGSKSAGQDGTKGLLKKVNVPIFIAVGLLTVIVLPWIATCPGGLFCWEEAEGAEAAELATVQTGIHAFMTDNGLPEISPSNSSVGGERISGIGTQFHATLNLSGYMRAAATTYCYRWQRDGLITFQYDINDEGKCAFDAAQLFP